jgi:hypothetical protein
MQTLAAIPFPPYIDCLDFHLRTILTFQAAAAAAASAAEIESLKTAAAATEADIEGSVHAEKFETVFVLCTVVYSMGFQLVRHLK